MYTTLYYSSEKKEQVGLDIFSHFSRVYPENFWHFIPGKYSAAPLWRVAPAGGLGEPNSSIVVLEPGFFGRGLCFLWWGVEKLRTCRRNNKKQRIWWIGICKKGNCAWLWNLFDIYIILYYSINMHVDISTEEEREREIEILMVGQLGISSSGPILSWKSWVSSWNSKVHGICRHVALGTRGNGKSHACLHLWPHGHGLKWLG